MKNKIIIGLIIACLVLSGITVYLSQTTIDSSEHKRHIEQINKQNNDNVTAMKTSHKTEIVNITADFDTQLNILNGNVEIERKKNDVYRIKIIDQTKTISGLKKASKTVLHIDINPHGKKESIIKNTQLTGLIDDVLSLDNELALSENICKVRIKEAEKKLTLKYTKLLHSKDVDILRLSGKVTGLEAEILFRDDVIKSKGKNTIVISSIVGVVCMVVGAIGGVATVVSIKK